MSLFSWGANSHGQLGHGIESEACCRPTEVTGLAFDPSTITCISGGGGHTFILDKTGDVFGVGWNCKGQLGIEGKCVSTFHPIKSLQRYKISQLVCGWDSSLAITADGAVVVWGSNSFSQLGTSKKEVLWTHDPQVIPFLRAKQASLGLRHLALVTLDGSVFVSGNGNKGQLGITDANGHSPTEINTLTTVPGITNISSIACGQHHTVALSVTGQVYVWGDNKFGQLGLDPKITPTVRTPRGVSVAGVGYVGQVTSVFCGWTHTVLLTDKGEIINWGRNSYGQLGVNNKVGPVIWNPTCLKHLNSSQQICIGSEHNLALSDDGKVFSWGWNEHGNCGTGSLDNVLWPEEILTPKMSKAVLIGCGACHSFAVLHT